MNYLLFYEQVESIHQLQVPRVVPRVDGRPPHKVCQAHARQQAQDERIGGVGGFGLPLTELLHQDIHREGRALTVEMAKDQADLRNLFGLTSALFKITTNFVQTKNLPLWLYFTAIIVAIVALRQIAPTPPTILSCLANTYNAYATNAMSYPVSDAVGWKRRN